ncbi:MAG: hypothetical protein ACYCVH_15575 [Ignavibacteriaceae bacterium]
MPLKAGMDEARMGLLYFTANKDMKVDIGNSVDVFGFNFPNNSSRITVGAEFMAYALVTSYLAYRLQIDEIDGFFGGNIVYSKKIDDGKLFARFRYIHSSGHLVDGHWDNQTNWWIDNKLPSAYGDNYADFLVAKENPFLSGNVRYYGGVTMSTGKKTGNKILRRFQYKTGVEFSLANLFGNVLNQNENIFTAVELDVKGIPVYVVNQNYLIGLKFGSWNNKGVVFYISYYNGSDVFSQYFTQRVSRFGVGFMFDFI